LVRRLTNGLVDSKAKQERSSPCGLVQSRLVVVVQLAVLGVDPRLGFLELTVFGVIIHGGSVSIPDVEDAEQQRPELHSLRFLGDVAVYSSPPAVRAFTAR
jgi:hypothetical protein